MSASVFFIGYVLLLLAGQATVILKRKLKIPYDRKVLVAILLFGVTSLFAQFVLGEEFAASPSMVQKVAYLGWLLTATNAAMQFVLWLFYTFLIRKNIVRIPRFLFDLLIFFVLIVLMLALVQSLFDKEIQGIVIGSTVLSAVIGLSLQDTLSNLFAGLAIQIESPFEVGDWVVIGGHEGRILSQNWRTLTIQTRESNYVSFTNKQVSNEKIINFSKPSNRQIHNLFVTFDYSYPPNVIKDVLNKLIAEVDEIQEDPRLGAFVHAYTERGITYVMKFWLYDYGEIVYLIDKVQSRLWYLLNRNDIQVAYPIQKLHLENNFEEKSREKIRTLRGQWHKELAKIPLLRGLNAKQLQFLTDNIDIHLFSKDDMLVKQGDIGDSMFFILSGQAKVYLDDGKGKIYVADKNRGDYFGEMSLLTGNPRSATVVAHTDMNTAIINKASFGEILAQDEDILDKLLTALERNNADLSHLLEKANEDKRLKSDNPRAQVVRFIKRYLGLE